MSIRITNAATVLATLLACSCSDAGTGPAADAHGVIRIRALVSGTGLAPDGFQVAVGPDVHALPADTPTIIAGLRQGDFAVGLGLPAHCVTDADHANVAVVAGDTVDLDFAVLCVGDYAYLQWDGASGDGLHYMDPYGATRLLTAGPVEAGWSWSPDGTRIAYVQQTTESLDVFVVGLDGAAPLQLTSSPATHGHPSWSPDGTALVYSSGDPHSARLFIVAADGSSLTPLIDLPGTLGGPAWSPIGDPIVYGRLSGNNRLPQDLWSITAAGSDTTQLTTTGTLNFGPVWSHDGQQIAFTAVQDGGMFALEVMAADGSGRRTLATSGQAETGLGVKPRWSPDGATIAFVEYTDHYLLTTVDVATAEQQPLTTDLSFADAPEWMPDGQHLLFVAPGSNTLAIWVVNADGTARHRLTPDGRSDPRLRPHRSP